MTYESIVQAFLATCERTPGKALLLFEGQSYTCSQLYQAALNWAERLRNAQASVQPGDRVGLYLENSPAFLAAYLGIHLAGGIAVLINTQYRRVELRHILNDAAVSVCITDNERLSGLQQIRRGIASLKHEIVVASSNEGFEPARGDSPPVIERPARLPGPEDIALLSYTSGTTGRSKGAMLSHRNLAANSAAVTAAWHWTASDVLLLTLPLFHIHGLGVGIHGTLLTGSTVDLRRRFDAAEVYDTLLGGTATMFFGVPTMYTRLIAEARQRDQRPPPIRLYVSGSAPLSPTTLEEFEQLMGQRILERYGMTETVMNLTNPYDGERRPGTVGQPFPGQEARIVDILNREPVPDGTPGEIQVRGRHVFQGYWRQPEATAEAFDSEGWFNTGDLGWRSADGYYTISGRARELIISGGYNVYPREVEEVIASHPEVIEVAVLGLPHPDLGEQVTAVVVSRQSLGTGTLLDGLTTRDNGQRSLAEEIVELCRIHLAGYKKPRQVFFVDTLPRNAMGKVQKHILKEQLQNRA